jgi:formylmethanofuran dehydrogenase subunit E
MENKRRPQWYAQAQFIRKRRNHLWTGQEFKKVYDLRIQKVPVDIIIDKLHLEVKRTQVYNILRMMKKNRKRKCSQCGEDLTKKELRSQRGNNFKICTKCQEKNTAYKQASRIANYGKGLCTCCGKTPPLKDRKTCMHCLSYTHRNRIVHGLCGSCGKNPLSRFSTALCDGCLKVNRINARRKRLTQRKGLYAKG